MVDLFTLLLCLLIAFVLTRGVRKAARRESVLVWLKVGLVILIVALGVFYVNTDNYPPFGWSGSSRARPWCSSPPSSGTTP